MGVKSDRLSVITLLIFISSYIGGKVFLWFEDLPYFIANPSKLFELNGNGFVFYGSLIFSFITLTIYFRMHKLNALKMFDILAVSACLVHGFGKIGCFLAGCCNGKVCNPAIGIIFTDPASAAEPLKLPLYPTQLVDALILFGCLALLLFIRRKPHAGGMMALTYLSVYATGRFFTEFLRGDERGEYLFNHSLSHSQVISILILIFSGVVFYILRMEKVSR